MDSVEAAEMYIQQLLEERHEFRQSMESTPVSETHSVNLARCGSGTALGGTSAKFSVTGTWFIGLDVFEFPVGASFDETLNSPTIDITVN